MSYGYENIKEGSNLNLLLGKPATKEDVIHALFEDKEDIPENIKSSLAHFCDGLVTEEEWNEIYKSSFIYPFIEVKTDLTEVDIINLSEGTLDDAKTQILIDILSGCPDKAKILTTLDFALRSGIDGVIDLSDPARALEEYERLQIPLNEKEEMSLKRTLQEADMGGYGDILRYRLHLSEDGKPFTPGLVHIFLNLNKASKGEQVQRWKESKVKPIVEQAKTEKVLNDVSKLEGIKSKVDSLVFGATKVIENGTGLITNPDAVLKTPSEIDSNLAFFGAQITLSHNIANLLDRDSGLVFVPDAEEKRRTIAENIAILNSLRGDKEHDIKKVLGGTDFDEKYRLDETIDLIAKLLGEEPNTFNINAIEQVKLLSKEIVSNTFDKVFRQNIVQGHQSEIADVIEIEDKPLKIAQLLERAIIFKNVLEVFIFNIDDQSIISRQRRFIAEFFGKDPRVAPDYSTLIRSGQSEEASLVIALGAISEIEEIQRINEINVRNVLRNSLQSVADGKEKDSAKEMIEMYFYFKSKQSLHEQESSTIYSAVCSQLSKQKYFEGSDPRRELVFNQKERGKIINIAEALRQFQQDATPAIQGDLVPEDLEEQITLDGNQIINFETGIRLIKDTSIKGLLETVHNLVISEGIFPKRYPKLNALKIIAQKIGVDIIHIENKEIKIPEVANGQESQLEDAIIEKLLPNPNKINIEALDQVSLAKLDDLIKQYEANITREQLTIQILTGRLGIYRELIDKRNKQFGISKLEERIDAVETSIDAKEQLKTRYMTFLNKVGVEIK